MCDSREIDQDGFLVVRKFSNPKPILLYSNNHDQTIYNNHFANEIKAAARYIHNTPVSVLKQLPAEDINRLEKFIGQFNDGQVFAEQDAQFFVSFVRAMQDVGL